ncbi:hypothetical protein JHK87_055868 [Glycine soja]|nr:hypothetical protein JHK87_055868 [Glycine soja]
MNSCETLVDDDVIIDEIGLELLLNCLRLENDRDVLSMCQIGLADSEKEVHVYLENADPERGHVSDIGLVIEVHAMPINCSAENVVEAVAEECTHNDIEDMDVDVAKGGSDDEN